MIRAGHNIPSQIPITQTSYIYFLRIRIFSLKLLRLDIGSSICVINVGLYLFTVLVTISLHLKRINFCRLFKNFIIYNIFVIFVCKFETKLYFGTFFI